jgi:hypothetical protein
MAKQVLLRNRYSSQQGKIQQKTAYNRNGSGT